MRSRLTRSLQHRLVRADLFHLALCWWRLEGRRGGRQLGLDLKGGL